MRASSALHDMDEIVEENKEDADVPMLPAEQEGQDPEHALVESPAWSPNVPDGHRVQTEAPSSE